MTERTWLEAIAEARELHEARTAHEDEVADGLIAAGLGDDGHPCGLSIEHLASCEPSHMTAPDFEGLSDCMNCGLWERLEDDEDQSWRDEPPADLEG